MSDEDRGEQHIPPAELPSQHDHNEVPTPDGVSADVIMQEAQSPNPSKIDALRTPTRPVHQKTSPSGLKRSAVGVYASPMGQDQPDIPHRRVTPQSCEVLMRGIDFEVGAQEALSQYALEHQQTLDNLMSRLFAAVIQYLGFQGELTAYQHTEVTRFVLAILSRSQDELSNATSNPLQRITDEASAMPTHLENVVTVLWDADRKLRPRIPNAYLDEARALVRIAAMRLQRELVQEWIEAINQPRGAAIARVVDVAERDAAASTPARKKAGRPLGSTKAKIEAAKANAKKTLDSTKKMNQSQLQSPFTTPTRPQYVGTSTGNAATLHTSLGFIPHHTPLNIFSQPQNQFQAGYGQGQQFLTPQQSQHTPTSSDWNNSYQNYNLHNPPIFTPRANENQEQRTSPYAGFGSVQTAQL